MDKVVLSANEMDKLAHLWESHRSDCKNDGRMEIALSAASGIGTAVQATCGCGKEMDVTDYYSW